jgi:hypothetical protein
LLLFGHGRALAGRRFRDPTFELGHGVERGRW